MARCMLLSLLPLVLVAVVSPARGSDGVTEINQACANAGCFAGDAAGLPVTISASGSYRLTSDLASSDISTSGVVISANDVAIDLNGFAIRGPAVCAATCPTGGGRGIVRSSTQLGQRVSVRNGFVRGFGSVCIHLTAMAEVRNVVVFGCGGDGIDVGPASLVESNRVASINGDGIVLGTGAAAGGNAIASIGLTDVNAVSIRGGRRFAGNSCELGDCSARGARLFYLTKTGVTGSGAPTACDAGFHFAAVWELADPSNLHYDESRGASIPPVAGAAITVPANLPGWLRTSAANASFDDCLGWANDSFPGSIGQISNDWAGASDPASPWMVEIIACTNPFPVWCVQD